MRGRAESGENRDVLSLLKEAQRKSGYISQEQISEIAGECQIPVGHLYGLATFYTFLSTIPLGRNVISICRSVPCYLQGGDMVAKTIEETLGIKPGETSQDRRFSLRWVNCLGVCDKAPAMMVNDQVYLDLTPKRVIQILDRHK